LARAHTSRRFPIGKQIPGLAAQYLAQPGQGTEPDRPGSPVLEYRQVDDRDADPVRQLGERDAALGQQVIEAHPDRVRLGRAVTGLPRRPGVGAHGHTVA
jgi:hypothetical protein